jgi:hypothetical protein
MGQVEFTMLMVVDLVSDAGIEALFDEYAAETFSGKVKWFRKWCAHTDEHFSAANKTRLRTIYKDLDELLPKRNSLVHGETYEEDLSGAGKQTYRVGVEKDNLEYLEEFSRGKKKGTIFSVQRVREDQTVCTNTGRLECDKRSNDPAMVAAVQVLSDAGDCEDWMMAERF